MPIFQRVQRGGDKDFNCSTNDPNATVAFWMKKGALPWKKRELKPEKLVRKGDVFTLLKIDSNDAYSYRCQAVSSTGQTIMTPKSLYGSYLLLIDGQLSVVAYQV